MVANGSNQPIPVSAPCSTPSLNRLNSGLMVLAGYPRETGGKSETDRDRRDERGFEVLSSRFSELRIPNFGSRLSD